MFSLGWFNWFDYLPILNFCWISDCRFFSNFRICSNWSLDKCISSPLKQLQALFRWDSSWFVVHVYIFLNMWFRETILHSYLNLAKSFLSFIVIGLCILIVQKYISSYNCCKVLVFIKINEKYLHVVVFIVWFRRAILFHFASCKNPWAERAEEGWRWASL